MAETLTMMDTEVQKVNNINNADNPAQKLLNNHPKNHAKKPGENWTANRSQPAESFIEINRTSGERFAVT